MSSIPEDVYLQILLRVPVKSTFVCKCVCKNWLDIISSPKFVKMHLHFNIQKKNYNLMFNEFDENSQLSRVNTISFDTLSSVTSTNEFQDGVVNMTYPFISADHEVTLKTSCKGLVCLSFYDGTEFLLCLWNPATNEFKILPEPPREDSNESEDYFSFSYLSDFFAVYALGYDCNLDDYKLLKVLMGGRDSYSLAYIYTLGSNSWKSIKTIPFKYYLNTESTDEIVCGALHWLIDTSINSKAIYSLDIIRERLEELQLPEEPLVKKQKFTVGKWDESLCLLVNADNNNIQFDVWVMQEYGVKDSWSKHFSVTLRSVDDSLSSMMWSFKNGKILLKTSSDLVLYDSKNASPRESYIRHQMLEGEAQSYVESLVSLNSGTYVGR